MMDQEILTILIKIEIIVLLLTTILMTVCIIRYRQIDKIKKTLLNTTQSAIMSYVECMNIVDDIINTVFLLRGIPNNRIDSGLFNFDAELSEIVEQITSAMSSQLRENLYIYINEDYLITYIVKTSRNRLISGTITIADDINLK